MADLLATNRSGIWLCACSRLHRSIAAPRLSPPGHDRKWGFLGSRVILDCGSLLLLVGSSVAKVASRRYPCGLSVSGRSELSPLGGRLQLFERAGDRAAELPGGAAEVERAAAVGEQ